MKQILQNLKTGKTELADVPAPVNQPGHVLIQTKTSLISAGTERMLVEFGRAGLVSKARSQPDKVKQVLDKTRAEGLLPTLETVFKRLDEPFPLGYCNAGVVVNSIAQSAEREAQEKEDHGPSTTDQSRPSSMVYGQSSQPKAAPSSMVHGQSSLFSKGERVISNGPHAEFVSVPANLCAKIPDNVTDEEACFTVLGSIGLQGIRLADPKLGESVAVFGLGLIGQMCVQMLMANGCRVMGFDLNEERMQMAEKVGAKAVNSVQSDPITAAQAWTEGRGVDAVIITAASKSDEIMHQAAQMTRKRGRVILVGVVGLNLNRADFYEKEITFQVSCSYGPGRYDEDYELKGRDYPYGLVRWTEQRNFEAVLELMASGKLDVRPLISRKIPFAEATKAYDTLLKDPRALGMVLEYGGEKDIAENRTVRFQTEAFGKGACVMGIIGAGNFTKMTLMPALAKTRARVKMIADLKGAAAAHLARKYKAEQAVSDHQLILNDPEINTVLITTGHSCHAALVLEGLKAGKQVFVEKPLAMNEEELGEICKNIRMGHRAESIGKESGAQGAEREAQEKDEHGPQTTDYGPALTVGFNRRFSPHITRVKAALGGRMEPLTLTMTVNAGIIPSNHWVHDPERGGGRIIGEACHFLDLMTFLTGSQIKSVSAGMVDGMAVNEDKMSILLTFEDGSVGTVNYFANGPKSYPKERLNLFWEGKALQVNNFRETRAWGVPGFRTLRTRRPEKGHLQEMKELVRFVEKGGEALIPLEELVNVTLASFAAMESAKERRVVEMGDEYKGVLSLLGQRA
ncbi:MAG TPA: dehydrogenase [bacterium]|mgnify:CR=1 FL=1|nr:dehydrogenase [bacterium]